MGTFLARGVVTGAAAFLFGTAAEAAMPVTPLTTGADVVNIAQGCGPGRWRGPYGGCGGGYHPYYHGYYGYHPYYHGYYHNYYHQGGNSGGSNY
jgi:hypothetical protein